MTSSGDFRHVTVLPSEAVELLCGGGGRRFVDCTLGGGGHSERVLSRLPDAEVLGIDCDSQALSAASARLAPFGSRLHVRQGRFSNLASYCDELGWGTVDGVLMDLGVSSPQIDEAERGFSFRFDGPLDMRMDRRSPLTAAVILNTHSEADLADILFRYGEEHRARAIARAIVRRRVERPWATTGELAELIERIVGRANQHGLPPATRSFQALRIAVNDELGELERTLPAALERLVPGGRLVVISFHSLEDRLVKNFFRDECRGCVCPPDFPVCVCGRRPRLRILTRKPLEAGEAERLENRRASCARLRAAERI